MLFTQYVNVDLESTFDNSNDIDMYALEEALNESEFNMKVFDYEYNHEFHNVEMIAIEAYKESNGNTAVLESQLDIIKEGFLGKIWDKFKSFLKMIWDAIVKAITKLLEWLRIKKKKLEEEQEKAEEEVKETEKQSNISTTSANSSESTPKDNIDTEKPEDTSQNSEEKPKTEEPPKNMTQAVQQQEAKKKKEGHFADKKKPVERKDNRQWGKKTPSRKFARKIPVNMIVIQNGYIDINNASDILVKWEENIIKFFKYTASIVSELLSGKIPSGYDSLFKHDYDTHSDNTRDKYGYYNATKEGERNYIELMWNKSGVTGLYQRVTIDDKENKPENWALDKLSKYKFNEDGSVKIGRTVEKERQLRNAFITVSSKKINKNTISDIKKSLDDVDRKLNNISDKSDLANQNVKINRLAYNGFRLAYLNQLMLVRGITKLIELSERGEREAIASHDKGEKAA